MGRARSTWSTAGVGRPTSTSTGGTRPTAGALATLTAVTGSPAAAGDPAGYVFAAQGTQHVVYRGVDGHIHELWWDATNGWSTGDLTAVTGAQAAASDPTGYAFEAQGTQHVVYRGVDGHIHEHWWDAANGWSVGDLTAVTGAPAGRSAIHPGTCSMGRARSTWSTAGWTATPTSTGGTPRTAGASAT